jgi:hypothetical protein
VTGTAEEKIPAIIKDIEAWPIPGLVVFAGEGFTENMKSFLIATGKAVEFDEVRPWLCLFFGLPLEQTAVSGQRSDVGQHKSDAGPRLSGF